MRRHRDADVLVVGAGIFGLSCAWACARRGLRVIVADRAEPGAGASGGPVGALAPHPPERWSAKRAFQLAALLGQADHWRAVTAAGGIDPGYARTGRLVPLATPAARALAHARANEAALRWGAAADWRIVPAGHAPGWLAPAAAPEGAVLESLSARIDPRRALAALVAALRARGGELRTGWSAQSVEPGRLTFDHGRITADAVILAAGTGGFALMEPFTGQRLGIAVKGQAALLAPGPAALPMLTDGSLYVVPQADGTVAVGATSEDAWDDPTATDRRLDALIARARALCPALAAACVLRRWAGLRPRGPRPDPMLGPLPGAPGVYVANGAFRTGFSLAPAVGEILADMVTGANPPLPPGFALADHLSARRPS